MRSYKGYGSGASRRLWAQTKIHSANEGAFRFADAEELALVEHERIRLEKERRIMDQQEVFFYDFQDLQVRSGSSAFVQHAYHTWISYSFTTIIASNWCTYTVPYNIPHIAYNSNV